MKQKLIKFINTLDMYGDMYFSQGSIKKDYKYITSILKYQGYFSGCAYRYYFNDNFDLIKIEARR